MVITGVNPYIFQLALAIAYPYALSKDANYVRTLKTNWRPGKYRYLGLGLLVFASMGVLSLIISPYYLIKRKKHTGAP